MRGSAARQRRAAAPGCESPGAARALRRSHSFPIAMLAPGRKACASDVLCCSSQRALVPTVLSRSRPSGIVVRTVRTTGRCWNDPYKLRLHYNTKTGTYCHPDLCIYNEAVICTYLESHGPVPRVRTNEKLQISTASTLLLL